MRSFPKAVTALAVTLAAAALAVSAYAQKKDEEKPKAKDKKEAVKKPDTKAAKEKDGKDKAKEPGKIDIPVSEDHDAKGLKIPYFDGDGKKQMIFTIGVASKIDAEHIAMTDTEVETFDENGEHDMSIALPKSVLNVNTSVISTKHHVDIKRDDFELTGETMEFNMKTRQGTLGGGVRMLIYNLVEEEPDAPQPKKP